MPSHDRPGTGGKASGPPPAAVQCCLQGLELLHQRTGRNSEWDRLVTQVSPAFMDPDTDGPLPGREEEWRLLTGYRVRLAMAARDWPAATRLQSLRATFDRDQAAAALETPDSELSARQRHEIRSLAVTLQYLGYILYYQQDPACLPAYLESLALVQRVQDTAAECALAASLGTAYLRVPGLRDLDQAQRWHQRSLDLEPETNPVGRAKSFGQLAGVAFERFAQAQRDGQPAEVLLEFLNAALDGYLQSVRLLPADDLEDLATAHNQLGNVYRIVREPSRALQHYQQSIKYKEARGDLYGTGQTRFNIAVLLADDRRFGDALHYARAALHDYERAGPGAAEDADDARGLITHLEQEGG